MAAALRDIYAAIQKLAVKEGMTKQGAGNHDCRHHTDHGNKGEFVIHRQFQNDQDTGDRRSDYRTCHCCHATNGKRRL